MTATFATIAPAGPYAPVSSAPPRHWQETRYRGAVPRPTATSTVRLHPSLARVTRALPHMGEAIGINAHHLRRAVATLRAGVDEYRAGYACWNAANAQHHLEQIRHARTLHSRAIRRALAVAKEMQG